MNELRSCLGSSIRGARHYSNRLNRILAGANAVQQQRGNHPIEVQQELRANQDDDDSTNIMENGRSVDDDDCF
jgi:hypothetical protein